MTHPDTATLIAAASLARHAPPELRAAHLAPKLEALAQELRETPRPCPCGSPICPTVSGGTMRENERSPTLSEACEQYRDAAIALMETIARELRVDRLVRWLSRRP